MDLNTRETDINGEITKLKDNKYILENRLQQESRITNYKTSPGNEPNKCKTISKNTEIIGNIVSGNIIYNKL